MGPIIKAILAVSDRLYNLSVVVYAVSGLFALAETRLAWVAGHEAAGQPMAGYPFDRPSAYREEDHSAAGAAGKTKLYERLARLCLVIFVLAGVPKLLTFHAVEWRAAVKGGNAGILLVKISALFLIAIVGTVAWIKAGKREKAAVRR